MTATDDRVVLPLSRVREASSVLCRLACAGGPHHRACLVPVLARRDADLDGPDLADVVLPDCRDGKHQACTGCACACHRHHNLTPPKVNRPELKKGDRVSLVWGGCTTWVVTEVDDDGNGTLEPAPDA